MDKIPKVSVIMPIYNSVNYINGAIDSILEQTFQNFELILVDDCSNDGTKEIIEAYSDTRIKILYNDCNKGVAYSRNRALDASCGEYIAIMDHDDVSLPIRLERQVRFLDTNTQYGVVGGRVQFIDSSDTVIKESGTALVNPNYIKANFLFRNVYCNSEVMFRRELIDSHNIRYEDGCYGMEDFKFWIKVSKITQMTNIDELFLLHRVHGQSLTNKVEDCCARERTEKFRELREYSWELSGLQISREIAETIHKYIGEDVTKEEISKEELYELYAAFQQFLKECRKLDNYNEVALYCRNRIVECVKRIGNFWEEEV